MFRIKHNLKELAKEFVFVAADKAANRHVHHKPIPKPKPEPKPMPKPILKPKIVVRWMFDVIM